MLYDRCYLELHYLHYQKKGLEKINPYQLLQDCLLSPLSLLQVGIGVRDE